METPLPSSRIVGTGRALPERVLSNFDLEGNGRGTAASIFERTGIQERRILEKERSTSDLAIEAARGACDMAGIEPSELDCIIVATVTPDSPLPSTAVTVQKALGAGPCPAFDISAACAGFLYGLAIADSLIRANQCRRALVVGVEVISRILDWSDVSTSMLFGDGAGAVVLMPAATESAGAAHGILSIHLGADGAGANDLFIAAGGSRCPATVDTVNARLHTVRMNGKAVFAAAVRTLARSCEIALAANGLSPESIDLVVPHQANVRILQAVANRVGLTQQQVYVNINRYGNTSSASVPIALDEAVRTGRVRDGATVLLCAFGAGFAWGSAVMRW